MDSIIYILKIAAIGLYGLSLAFILVFSLTQVQLLFRYIFLGHKYRAERRKIQAFESLPFVTVQLPVYNEKYVGDRLIDCVSQLDYPRDRFEIQVLDDSTDETTAILQQKIQELSSVVNIKYIHRTNRAGYKAGALKAGLATARGEFIAIFDADFLPAKDFLLKCIHQFTNPKVGMVQTRWTWLNKNYSLITRVQAFALDTHFSIEQVGRNIGKSFINFNGTGGIWRKSCIVDAGNWEADTLTEDLDLSYRAQFKNWQFVYLEEVGAPSELPPVMSAVKTQQYRWNKGGAETARKHLRELMSSPLPFATKWHGVMHLLTSGMFVCVALFAVLSIPVLLIRETNPAFSGWFKITDLLSGGFLILAGMFFITVMIRHKNKWSGLLSFLRNFPLFISMSMGLSLHNALAVLEGYFGKKTPFIRTPKFNVIAGSDHWAGNNYIRQAINKLTIVEAILVLYFLGGILLAFYLHNYSLLVFHVLLAFGFGAIVYYTLFQHACNLTPSSEKTDNKKAML